MSTFIERLQTEMSELDDKIEKLSEFLLSDNFMKIDSVQQTLLRIQHSAMITYRHCLNERLSRLV